jgi:parallel beta-helix repeat protein
VKKFTSLLVLLLFLSVVLVSLPQIGMVKADESIYIRADGSVEGTDKIQRVGNVYKFTDNISTGSYTGSIVLDVDGIIIERDNIVVDGVGYTLQAVFPTIDTGAGITLLGRSNVTIKNIQIRHYAIGIRFGNSSNSNIHGNNINTVTGIHIFNHSSSNIITGNSMTCSACDSWHGMIFSNSSDNIISENNITNNSYYGILLNTSFNNIFLQNNFINNSIQISSLGGSINVWDNGVSGNYWDDYTGADSGGDGIGDTPYVIGENNIDNSPLMQPVVIPEFPSWTPLLIALVAVVAIAVVYRRKFSKTNRGRDNQ